MADMQAVRLLTVDARVNNISSLRRDFPLREVGSITLFDKTKHRKAKIMTSTEKLGEKCFSENLQLFSNPQIQPEKYNLYTGLMAMSVVLEEVVQTQRNIQTQLNQLIQVVDQMSRS